MKLTASFALGFVIMLTACDRIEHARVDRDYRLFSRREQAFSEDMAHMANAKDTIYRLDYVLSDDWLRSFSSDSHSFRAMPGGRFDMLPWLQSAGLARTENTSAVFDLFKHTVTVIGPGPSAALIARLIEPLRPDKCASIAPKK